MITRNRLLRLAAVVALLVSTLICTAGSAAAATSWSGTKNCGSDYVQLGFSSATGTYDINKVAFEHVDYGATSYTVHHNYEIQPVYVGDVVRTQMHSVKWSIYIIGSAHTKTPTAVCIGAAKNYSTHTSKSGSKNCGSKRVSVLPNGYAFELDVNWTGSSPTSAGSRAYFPVLATRYAFEALTGEHSISWTVTARGVMPLTSIDPTIYELHVDCY